MGKQFGQTIQRHITAAYEQGVRDGIDQAIRHIREEQAKKSLRGKLKRRVKRDKEAA